jgi:hypothetical protein
VKKKPAGLSAHASYVLQTFLAVPGSRVSCKLSFGSLETNNHFH